MANLEELFPDIHQEEERASVQGELPSHLHEPLQLRPVEKQNIMQPQKKRRGLIGGMITAVLVLLCGGTAFAMWQGYIPMPGFLTRLAGGRVLAESIEQLLQLQSARYTIDISAALQNRDTDATPINFQALEDAQDRVRVEGANNNTSQSSWLSVPEAHAQTSIDFVNTTTNAAPNTNAAQEKTMVDSLLSFVPENLNTSVSMSGIFRRSKENVADAEFGFRAHVVYDAFDESMAAETKIASGSLYVLLSELPGLLEDQLGTSMDFTPLLNTWIAVSADSVIARASGFDTQDITNVLQAPTPEETIVSNAQTITQALLENNLFTIRQTFADEKIGEIDTRHVRVGVNPDKIEAAYRSVTAALAAVYPEQKITVDEDVAAVLASDEFRQFYASLEHNTTFDIWTDTKTQMPIKVEHGMRLIPNMDDVLPEKQLHIAMSVTLADVNAPIVVSAPDSAKGIDVIAQETFGLTATDLTAIEQFARLKTLKTALSQYEADHNFIYPHTLDALVPQYIDAVPVDVYTQQVFPYTATSEGSSWEIQYQAPENIERLNIPLFSLLGSIWYSISDVLPGKVNTATPYYLSKESRVSADQISAVGSVRGGLRNYFRAHHTFPATLDILRDEYSYVKTTDLITNEPFIYTLSDDVNVGYTLIYQFPIEGKAVQQVSYEVGYIADGTNTATMETISKEGFALRDELAGTETPDYYEDRDNDGLADYWELASDSNNVDSDGDGLHDGVEVNFYDSQAGLADSDGDGFDDYTEVLHGYDPTGAGLLTQ